MMNADEAIRAKQNERNQDQRHTDVSGSSTKPIEAQLKSLKHAAAERGAEGESRK